MKNVVYRTLCLGLAALLCACGRNAPVPEEKKTSPARVLDQYAAQVVQQNASTVHGHSAPMQTLDSPLSYVTQFFTKAPSMLTLPEKSAYRQNLAITEKWQRMYCTDELQAHLLESGVAIASAQLVDSSTGQKHSLAMCLAAGPKPSLSAAAKAPAAFSLASLDAGKVDPDFNGIAPVVLLQALEGIMEIRRGEFESTRSFIERRDSLLAEKIVGEYGLGDAFPFIVDVDQYSPCSKRIGYGYDADTSKATLHLPIREKALSERGSIDSAYGAPPRYDMLELQREYEKEKTYMGVNAFGVSTPVRETNGIVFAVAAKKIPYIKGRRTLTCEENAAAFAFDMDAATAEKELPSLKAMVVLKLKPPYVLYDDYYKEPTRDDPVEASVQTRAFFGEVARIVVYSGITGKIVTQFPHQKHP